MNKKCRGGTKQVSQNKNINQRINEGMRCFLLQNSQKNWQPRKYAKTNSACAADVRCNQKIKMDCVVICRLTTKLSDPMCMLSWMQGPLGRTAHHAHLTGVPVQTVRFKPTADKIWEPKPPQAARPTPELGPLRAGCPQTPERHGILVAHRPRFAFPFRLLVPGCRSMLLQE